MTWFWGILALILLLDAFRVRRRVEGVPVLRPANEPVSPDHLFLLGRGVALDEATRQAASAHAREHGLSVLDLVPADLPTLRAWSLFQLLDPSQYRTDRIGRGRSARQAILVTRDVLQRARVPETAPDDPATFARLSIRLKHYASTATDVAIAPSLHAQPEPRGQQLAVIRDMAGDGGVIALLLSLPFLFGLMIYAAISNRTTGMMPWVVFHLQPLIAFARGRLKPKDLAVTTLFRGFKDVWIWFGLLLEPKVRRDAVLESADRKAYDALLAGGLERFFEPRVQSCQVCGGSSLEPFLQTTDLFQHKPGHFTLERCQGCGHIFQNPRLSLDGLAFYYRDCYDGRGADHLERLFGAQEGWYLARARTVAEAGDGMDPKRWLDVGGGHGHFCGMARGVWPKTSFDGLDLSEGIEEGKRRGWLDECYRGLFPEVAQQLRGAYDVVSMCHYLEHTRDLRAEIAAARVALKEGGLLLIELPDPTSVFGKILGRFWGPWFQPQHQHLLSPKNLDRLLREAGFSTLVTHRGKARQEVDFAAAPVLFLDRLMPAGDLPWRSPKGGAYNALRTLLFALGAPLVLVGRLIDVLGRPFFLRADASNAFRVLGRKEP